MEKVDFSVFANCKVCLVGHEQSDPKLQRNFGEINQNPETIWRVYLPMGKF